MEKIILIIIIIISLIYIYCNCKYEGFSKNLGLNNIYGPNSSRVKDLANTKKKYTEKIIKTPIKNNINIQNYKTYKTNNVSYISETKKKKIKIKVPKKINNYKYKGVIGNIYYKQYYYLYEKEYENYDIEDKLFEYILVKKINNKFEIVYTIPPKSFIKNGDTIYFSYGNFQLGPLIFI